MLKSKAKQTKQATHLSEDIKTHIDTAFKNDPPTAAMFLLCAYIQNDRNTLNYCIQQYSKTYSDPEVQQLTVQLFANILGNK